MRSFASGAIAAFGVAATAVPAGATVVVGEAIEVRGWVGGEEFSARDGSFVRCVITRQFAGDVLLSFAVTADRLFIVQLAAPDWADAAERQSPPLALRFDGSGAFVANFDVTEVGVDLPFDAWTDLSRKLRQSEELTITLGDLSTTLPLTGTSSALPALERCADRHR